MDKEKVYTEYLGAYDGWLSWMDKYNGDEFHRADNSKIIEIKQPIEYGPVYFKTESGYFKNLYSITKEEYDNITKSETTMIG